METYGYHNQKVKTKKSTKLHSAEKKMGRARAAKPPRHAISQVTKEASNKNSEKLHPQQTIKRFENACKNMKLLDHSLKPQMFKTADPELAEKCILLKKTEPTNDTSTTNNQYELYYYDYQTPERYNMITLSIDPVSLQQGQSDLETCHLNWTRNQNEVYSYPLMSSNPNQTSWKEIIFQWVQESKNNATPNTLYQESKALLENLSSKDPHPQGQKKGCKIVATQNMHYPYCLVSWSEKGEDVQNHYIGSNIMQNGTDNVSEQINQILHSYFKEGTEYNFYVGTTIYKNLIPQS